MANLTEFNLIVHGMVLVDEYDDQHWDIYVPRIMHHSYMWGNPGECDFSLLQTLPAGDSQLSVGGHNPPARSMRDMAPSQMEVMLRKKFVDIQSGHLIIRNRIRVPKPSWVRLFRGCEVARPVFTNPGEKAYAHGAGDYQVLNEVMVLRYTKLPDGSQIRCGSYSNVTGQNGPVNLCVYAQPDHAPGGPHGSEVNDLLLLGGANPSINLADVGMADPAHDTNIGVGTCELRSLRELKEGRSLADFVVCGRLWVANEG